MIQWPNGKVLLSGNFRIPVAIAGSSPVWIFFRKSDGACTGQEATLNYFEFSDIELDLIHLNFVWLKYETFRTDQVVSRKLTQKKASIVMTY